MNNNNWVKEFPVSVTVCDENGIIKDMNDSSVSVFEKDGGAGLIGSSVFDCHPEPSRTELKEMMKDERINVYTIEKNGKKKLIYQSPWYENGEYKGFVELSLPIPFEMKHFIRK